MTIAHILKDRFKFPIVTNLEFFADSVDSWK